MNDPAAGQQGTLPERAANTTPGRASPVAGHHKPRTVRVRMLGSSHPPAHSLPTIGIVIPTLNERRLLPGLLDHLTRLNGWHELVVSDGGSRDGTSEIARCHPLAPRVLNTNGGRAAQLNRALIEMSSDVVLTVGADLRPHVLALPAIRQAVADGAIAGCLRLHHSQRGLLFRWQDMWARLRTAWTDGAYLDQAPFFDRRAALAAGGFRDVGPYDTADLCRRLARRGTLRLVQAPVLASCRHWQRHGFWRGTLIHQQLRLHHLLRSA